MKRDNGPGYARMAMLARASRPSTPVRTAPGFSRGLCHERWVCFSSPPLIMRCAG
ncbi:MAG: hypothetical protein HYY01_12120 [Chloroflexi bacterium]|nr:hypothetical protein [Chloroflexota bacterium]